MAKDITVSNTQNAHAKSKQYHYQKAKEYYLALHDRILIRVSKVSIGISPKLFRRFDGPYYIVEIGPNFTDKLRRNLDHKIIKSPINATKNHSLQGPKHGERLTRQDAQDAQDPEPLQTDEPWEDTDEVPNNPGSDVPNDCPKQVVHPHQPVHQNRTDISEPWRDSYFVCLYSFYHTACHGESYLAPWYHFSVLLNIVITSLGEERADLYASCAFVCLSGM